VRDTDPSTLSLGVHRIAKYSVRWFVSVDRRRLENLGQTKIVDAPKFVGRSSDEKREVIAVSDRDI
jgi:hypothetical protein